MGKTLGFKKILLLLTICLSLVDIPLYAAQPTSTKIVTITGIVTERASQTPIQGAIVSVLYSGNTFYKSSTDSSGRYRLDIPADNIPSLFITVQKSGYAKPYNFLFNLKGGVTYTVNFSLKDIKPPVVRSVTIENGSRYTNKKIVNIAIDAYDNEAGLYKISFSNNGFIWSAPYPYHPSVMWTLPPGNGLKRVYVRAIDKEGNWSAPAMSSVILDTVPPILTITFPINGYLSGSQSITVKGVLNDKSAEILVNNIKALVRRGAFTASGVSLKPGENTITAIATDPAGNNSSCSIKVVYDNTPPSTPVVTDDGQYSNSLTTLHSSWSSQDPESGIAEYSYSIGTTQGGTDLVNWTSAGTATSVTRNELTLVAGRTYFINVKAKNKTTPAMWSSVGSSDGIVAGPMPLSVHITQPPDNTIVNTPNIEVGGTVSHSSATVIVNDAVNAVVTGNIFSANVAITGGENSIKAVAHNGSETADDTVKVMLDEFQPSITIFTPRGSSATRSNIVYGRVSDDTASVMVSGVTAELLADSRFIARPTLAEGQNIVTVIARDKAGNEKTASINITYIATSPRITIISPADGSTVNIAPIAVNGICASSQDYILVDRIKAPIDSALAFHAEGIDLKPQKTVITAIDYDADHNIFSDSIVIASPDVACYEIAKISGDADYNDTSRPHAGAVQILKVLLKKNDKLASGEEIGFSVSEGSGTLSKTSAFTDANGEVEVDLTTDTNAKISNKVECFSVANPLVKAIFCVNTTPSLPARIIKITDESITPVPGATVDLLTKLVDLNNNPIPNEAINFQVIQGNGALSAQNGITDSNGQVKVVLACPSAGEVLNQIKVSSVANPGVFTQFDIRTSPTCPITVNELFNKIEANAAKVHDQVLEVTINSNDPSLPPLSRFKVWQKGELLKVQDMSTGEIDIRPTLSPGKTSPADLRIVSFDPLTNIYCYKAKAASQETEKPYTLTYVDYSKGVVTRMEYYLSDVKFVTEMEDFVQIPETDNVWVYNKKTEKMFAQKEEPIYTTTTTVTAQQFNVGLTEADFK